MNNLFTANLAEVDPVINEAINNEIKRQTNGLELIGFGKFRLRSRFAGDGNGFY